MLGALHVLTGIAWFAYKDVTRLLSSDDVVCWPIVPCEDLRAGLSRGTVRALVAIYIGLGASASISFLTKRTRAAMTTLFLACLVGTSIYALDYRLRFNQTTMLAWVCIVFFLVREKIEIVGVLVAAFYFAAGLLKLTPDWLSGKALYAQPWLVPESLVPVACVYVVLLELVFVWGLFGKRKVVRRAVLAQLALFHVVSWPVVGWFYPLEMLGLLSIFVLVDRIDLRSIAKPAWPFLTAFALAQLMPACFRGDAALTGEGRIFALHMFDAKVSCEGGAIVRSPGQPERTLALTASKSDVRSQCDPVIVLAHARRTCREAWARAPGTRVDVAVDAKRASDPAMRPLVRIDDVCTSPPSYSAFHENAWIVAR